MKKKTVCEAIKSGLVEGREVFIKAKVLETRLNIPNSPLFVKVHSGSSIRFFLCNTDIIYIEEAPPEDF